MYQNFLLTCYLLVPASKPYIVKSKYFPDHCVFQNLQMGERIGDGRLHNGYMFDGTQTFIKSLLFIIKDDG